MNVTLRYLTLILLMWLMLTGVCLARQVYLKDGGIIDAQSAWVRGDQVFVKINRDIVAEFSLSEIDLRRSFPKKQPSSHGNHGSVVKAAAAPLKPAPVTAVVPAVPAAPATTAAKSTPAKPAPAPAPVVNRQTQQAAESADKAPTDKAELERRKQDAARMVAEAVMKKDPELMKKALEMQKSAMPQAGATSPMKAGIPLYVPLMGLVAAILIIVAQWIIFERAGRAGWKSLIPFYNMYLLMEISGKPGWWMFLLFIPLIGIIVFLFSMLSLARKFGRSELFGVGIALLPMIFMPVLAFGGSRYQD